MNYDIIIIAKYIFKGVSVMNQKKWELTGFQLKLIGIILMLCDHIHQMFIYTNPPAILAILGRLVFPIFLFLSAEGYHYTKNKKKYMQRLLIGFWLMNIGDVLIWRILPMEDVVLANNVFGALFLAVVCMYAIDCLKNKQWIKGIILLILPIVPSLMFFVGDPASSISFYVISIFPSYFTVEGGLAGIVLGVLFYVLREKRSLQFIALALIAILSTKFNFTGLFSTNRQWIMAFAIIPLALYNGQKGKGSKYFFYIFYPAHIYILYVFSYIYLNYFM